MALVTLLIGSLFPIIDLGRPDRMLNLLLHGQVGSPVLWDVVAVNTYLLATVIFLFLPLIPDMAFCRDHLGPAAGRFRKLLYDRLALGWRGTQGEKNILERNMTLTAVVIIRDFVIVSGGLIYQAVVAPVHPEPSRASKLNTGAQIFFICAVIGNRGFGLPAAELLIPSGAAVLVTATVSGLDYVVRWSGKVAHAQRSQ